MGHTHSTGLYGLSLSSFIIIYDFSSSFSFSSCQRCNPFCMCHIITLIRAINLSLNYLSRDKLRGPPLSSGSWLVLITLSLPYHTLWSLPLSESYCLRQEVRGRRGMPPTPTNLRRIPRSTPFLPAVTILLTLFWPAPPPFYDPLNRPLQYRFIRSVKVKVVILSGLLISPLYWAGQGAEF